MNYKKTIAMIMAAALCLGVTACGDDEVDEKTALMKKQIAEMEADMEGRGSESEKEKNDAVVETEAPKMEVPETEPEVPEVDFAGLEAQATDFGSCGDNVNWYLIGDELVIAGTGDMYGYSAPSSPPWYDFADYIGKVTIQEGVTDVGKCAFEGCVNIIEISLPSTLTSISNSAMYGCERLESINLPEGLVTLGDRVFWECKSLKSITIPGSVTNLGEYVFYNCDSLTSAEVLGEGIESLDECLFAGCNSLTNVTLPESLTEVGKLAFSSCRSLASIKLPDNVTTIG